MLMVHLTRLSMSLKQIVFLAKIRFFYYNKISLQFSVQKSSVRYSSGLVDFAFGQVNFILYLPNGQVKIFEEFKLQKKCEINSAHQNVFGAS